MQVDGRETFFCLTTRPEGFAAFELHGAYRSREVTGEAFHALSRLLRFVGHPVPAPALPARSRARPRGTVAGFRRLPVEAIPGWAELLRGESREALEALALELLEHPGAVARRGEIQEDLAALALFFETEARALARARAARRLRALSRAAARARSPLRRVARGATRRDLTRRREGE